MSNIDCSSSRGPYCLWLPCKDGGRHRITDSTILEFVSKHFKREKGHDCAVTIGLGFEVICTCKCDHTMQEQANGMIHNTLHAERDKPINKFSASINNNYEVNSCG
jgi:hypothetical protein